MAHDDEAANLRHQFISFDMDRDGVLNTRDFLHMLQQLNEDYSFMPKEGPDVGLFLNAQYKRAGGRRPDPDDSDDEGEAVSHKAFCKWYAPFVAACERRKQDEYEQTKDLSVPKYEAWLKERPFASRNRSYRELSL